MKSLCKKILSAALTFILSFTLFSFAIGAAYEIRLSKTDVAVSVGQTYQLKLLETKKLPVWKSSNKKIALVNKKGIVSGISKGTAEITATLGKKAYKCKITVETPSLSSKKAYVIAGHTLALKLNGTKRNAKWTSDNTKIAAVNQKGVVKGISKGTAKITASLGQKSYICKITVTKPGKFTLKSKNIKVRDEKVLTIAYTGNDLIYFKVENPEIISCKWGTGWNGNNIYLFITSLKSGKTKITLSNEAKTEKVVINVTVNKPKPIQTIFLSKPFVTLYSGDRKNNFNHTKLEATVVPSDTSRKVVWSSSDSTVAKVDKNGNVTAIDEGTAIITAKCGDKKATCEVEVHIHPLEGIEIEFENMSGDSTYWPSLRVSNFSDKEKDMTFSSSAELFIDKKHENYDLISYYPGHGNTSGFEWRVPKNKICQCTYRSTKNLKLKMTWERIFIVVATFDNEDYLIKVTQNGYSYTPYGESIPKNERFLYYGD